MSLASMANKPNLALIVGILVLASSTSIMTTDMYSPSLPDLVNVFDTTPAMMKLTISLNMLAFGIAQFFYGPLSDRFGRKPVMLASIASVIVLCFACTQVNTVQQLITVRVLLGLAAAAEAVLALAIIKDLYNEKEQIKVLGLLNSAIAVSPAVAPILGGYLHVHYGWTMNFYVLTVMACVALLVAALYLPESHTPEPEALQVNRVIGGYTRLFANKEFMVHAAMCGLSLGLIFVFVTGGPFVLIELLGVPIEHYGWYQAVFVVAFIIGSFSASRWPENWDSQRLLQGGGVVVLLGAALLVLLIAMNAASAVMISVSYSIMTLGMAGIFAVGPSRALRSITSQTGSASAMLSGMEQVTAALAAVAVSVFHDGSAWPMAWITLALALLLVPLLQASNRLNKVG